MRPPFPRASPLACSWLAAGHRVDVPAWAQTSGLGRRSPPCAGTSARACHRLRSRGSVVTSSPGRLLQIGNLLPDVINPVRILSAKSLDPRGVYPGSCLTAHARGTCHRVIPQALDLGL